MWIAQVATPDVTQFIDNPPIALLIIVLFGAIGVLATGKVLVPRFFYDREKERADKTDERLAKLTDLVEDYNEELREMRRGRNV